MLTTESVFTGTGLVFTGERSCELEELTFHADDLDRGQYLIALELSVVSAGTEVANFTGLEPTTRVPGSWAAYPHRPGYGAVGRIVAVSPRGDCEVRDLKVGARVFAICRHASYAIADTTARPLIRIHEDDDAETIVLARMASVAISALRKASSVAFGARAVVLGLGLVGNFAAQLLALAGMDVVAFDRVEHRVDMATTVGLRALRAHDSVRREVVEDGLGGPVDLVVEASGNPDAIASAVDIVGDGGEVILLGSPRGIFTGDATRMLSQIHARGIRLIGALEWLLPLRSGPWQARWSLYDDYAVLLDRFRSGAIRTDGLVMDRVRPDRAQELYTRLAAREPGMGAALFDWRSS